MAGALNIEVDVKGLGQRISVGLTVVLAGAAMLVGPGSARAQAPPDTSRPTYRGGVEAVTLSVAVRDGRGRPVRDLTSREFVVLDNGMSRVIRAFVPDEAAISLAVLLDISGSMAVSGNMDRARRVVEQTMARLQTGRDEAALLTFDHELREVRAFTTDVARVASVSLAGQPWGLTSLYDAVAETARRVGDRPNPHRAVLVVTDGVDTGSRLTAAAVSGMASTIGVPVYLVVVAAPVDNPARRLVALNIDGASTATATLEDLARWTGGDMVIVSTPEESAEALAGLVGALRHQYLITFEPESRPGWHPLEVRTTRRRVSVHARGGYMAGPEAFPLVPTAE